jgi:hypothetical protein
MACDPLLFSGIDASTLARIKESLDSAYGVRVDSDRGEQTVRGFTFEWEYDANAQTLRIVCSHKPLIVPCGVVNSRIDELARKSGVDPGAGSPT